MSKIYEALQNAQQEPRELQKPQNELTKTSTVTLLPSVVELDFEYEMVTLYQNLESRLPDLEKRVIQFISAREGEGTSTIVREFARVAAKKLGKSVFVLSAGHHNPRPCIFMHITPECGWEEVTRNGCVLGRFAECGEIDLEMCAAPTNSSITPLNFYSSQILDYWYSLKKRYDLIIVDSAPASGSPDGVEISRRVDGVVLVVEAEKTRWQVVENLKEKIATGGGNVLGMVFNKRRFYIPDAVYRRL